MTKKSKLWAGGILVLVLIPFLYSPIGLGCFEKPGIKFHPGKLMILDEPSYMDQEDEDLASIQTSAGNIVVFSCAVGYEDKTGTRHLPAARIKLSNASKLLFVVDFKVTKRAQIALLQIVNGPITNIYVQTEDDIIMIDALKDVVYRQEIELDLATAPPTHIPVRGLYEVGAVLFPGYTELPMLKTGGMSFASVRMEIR